MNFRTTNQRLVFIDRAASIRGINRTELMFLLSEVAGVLNERLVITLDAPVKPRPNLKEGFARRPLRERYPRWRRLAISTTFRGSTSGAPRLNVWLRGKTEFNEIKGGAQTYAFCCGKKIIGFYGLASSSMERQRPLKRVVWSMPETGDLSWTVSGEHELQGARARTCWLTQLGDRCRLPARSTSVIIVRHSTEG